METHLPALHVATAVTTPRSFIPLNYVHPGLTLAQVLAILRAHRRAFIAIFVTISAAAIVLTAMMPRTYEATAKLLVRYEVNDPLGGKEFPLALLAGYIATQTELLQGPGVLLPVIDQLQLTLDKHYTEGFNGDAADLKTFVLAGLQKRLTISQEQASSQLVHVTYAGRSPAEAAQVSNAIADVYVKQQNDRMVEPAVTQTLRYSEQVAGLRAKAERAQEQLTAFRDSNGLVDPTSAVDIDMGLLQTLEQKLLEAQNLRRAAEARSATDISVGSQVLNSTLAQTLKSQLSTLAARQAELQSSLGPQHPDMIALQAQIAQTRKSLAAEVGSYSANAASDIAGSRALESKLQVALDEQRQRVLKIRELQERTAGYQLELASAQAVYKRALDGFDQVAFAAHSRYNNVSVESRAAKPLRPSRPNVLKYSALGIMLGGFLGLALPLLFELVNRRVRCRDDLESDHGIPVLMEFDALAAHKAQS